MNRESRIRISDYIGALIITLSEYCSHKTLDHNQERVDIFSGSASIAGILEEGVPHSRLVEVLGNIRTRLSSKAAGILDIMYDEGMKMHERVLAKVYH